MFNFIVSENIFNMSLKDFLRREKNISLTGWRKIKRINMVYLNNTLVKPSLAKVNAGDKISYEYDEVKLIPPCDIKLDICFEDEFLLVINKPAGMLVHPTVKNETDSLANALSFYYQNNGLNYNFHPVHRLDKNTSGLLVIAKMPYIQNLFSLKGKNTIERIYQAVIIGKLRPKKGTIIAPIARKAGSIIERRVDYQGKEAITHYEIIAEKNFNSLVELKLGTGRTHQLRVHLAHFNNPILGDDLYGGASSFIQRQALHAKKIIFKHPITKEAIVIETSLPEDIAKVWENLV